MYLRNETVRPSNDPSKADRSPEKIVWGIWVSEKVRYDYSVVAAMMGMPIGELVENALNEWLTKRSREIAKLSQRQFGSRDAENRRPGPQRGS